MVKLSAPTILIIVSITLSIVLLMLYVLGPLNQKIPSETIAPPLITFCPQENCTAKLQEFLTQATSSIHCAFFEINDPKSLEVLQHNASNGLEVGLVVDADNLEDTADRDQKKSWVKADTSRAYMHNKFCIIDGTMVWTGSFNPTTGGQDNNNHVIIINSRYLGENYEEEFDELWQGTFGRGKQTQYQRIMVNNALLENYFCPDDCTTKGKGGITRVVQLIDEAQGTIEIAMFAFTADSVTEALMRAKQRGVVITVIVEKRNVNLLGSEVKRLKEQNITVLVDGNPQTMHHKFMVVDGKIVLLGSFNFSENANSRNDENMIILYDRDVAQQFLQEFERLLKEAYLRIPASGG